MAKNSPDAHESCEKQLTGKRKKSKAAGNSSIEEVGPNLRRTNPQHHDIREADDLTLFLRTQRGMEHGK
jgi:hypothetical protein